MGKASLCLWHWCVPWGFSPLNNFFYIFVFWPIFAFRKHTVIRISVTLYTMNVVHKAV